jgi:integrase
MVKVEQVTFKDYFQRFLETRTTKGRAIKPSTRDLYERLARTKLTTFMDMAISEITQQDVRDWHATHVASGKLTTVAHAYKLLKSVLDDALSMDLIPTNPCKLKGAQSASTGKKVVAPSTRDVIAISEHINPKYRLAVLVAGFAGLRFGELTELRRKDLQFSDTSGRGLSINVERAVTYVNKHFVVGLPKSRASVRRIPVTSELELQLKKHLLEMVDKSPDALLFPGEHGMHLRNDIFAKNFKRALSRAGVSTEVTPHGLRHHAASYLAKVGANLPELKEWLGDSSTLAATRYLHSTDRTEKLVEKMSMNIGASA